MAETNNHNNGGAGAGAAGAGGANRPQSSPLKTAPQMMNDRDEMKINLEDQSGSLDDQTYNHGTTAHY